MPKVLHLCKTPVAGAAGLLSNILDRYSTYESSVYTERKSLQAGDFSIDYQDSILESEIQSNINNSDIIHFHNVNPAMFNRFNFHNKPFIIQLHSEPKLRGQMIQSCPSHFKFITLAQKHAILYKNLEYVPNLIPIYDELYTPKKINDGKYRIVYAPTSKFSTDDYTNTCAGKGFKETTEALNRIKEIYKEQVIIDILLKVPKEEVLAIKRQADITIDECVTGGYHLSSLEGLSMGCATIAYLQPEVIEIICKVTGCTKESLPWVNVSMDQLFGKLKYFLTYKYRIKDYQKQSREWMEKYWSPEKLCTTFTRLYNNILNREDKPKYGAVSSRIDFVREKRNENQSKFYADQMNLELDLSNFKVNKSKPALILGNGPSVNRVNIDSILKNKNPDIFACNFYFRGFGHNHTNSIKPRFWSCIDDVALKNCIPYVDMSSIVITSKPAIPIQIPHKRIWIQNQISNFKNYFNFDFELERPLTVATIMVLFALYLDFNPIYILGVDLSTSKGATNYFYSNKNNITYNEKFKDFSKNITFIRKEFKLMKEEARRLGVQIFNLDPNPNQFNVFPKGEIKLWKI